MSRINTNVQSLLARRILGQQSQTLTKSLERLSTGLAINRGSDHPAGLIASENLRSQKASLNAAIGNAERANQVVNIAESGLGEISNLLVEVQALVTETGNQAGLSDAERQANQLQVDSILQTIDRIASTTSFQGTKLLNGTYDFSITNQNTAVAEARIDSAKLAHNETRNVQVVVTNSAQHGSLFLSAGSATNVLDFGGNASERFVLEIGGSEGTRRFSFASGTTIANVATSINGFKDETGISAVASAHFLELKSTEFGSSQFVSAKIVDDAGGNLGAKTIRDASGTDENIIGAGSTTFANANSAIRDTGQDVTAVINGDTAAGDGKKISINNDMLALTLELTSTGAQTVASINTALTVSLPAAKFSIGPSVDISNQVSLGLGNVAARNIGSISTGYMTTLVSGGANNLVNGNLQDAQKVIDESITQIARLRGRIGALQKNVIESTIRALGVILESTTAAESSIRDTDFAAETASLTRAQILVSAGTNVLTIANAQPQSALALLA